MGHRACELLVILGVDSSNINSIRGGGGGKGREKKWVKKTRNVYMHVVVVVVVVVVKIVIFEIFGFWKINVLLY